MRLSSRDLVFTLVLTLFYLLLVLGLTPVFTNALPGDLVLYSFVPATLIATGLVYLAAVYGRTRLGISSSSTHVEKEAARVEPYQPAWQAQPAAPQYAQPAPAYQQPQQMQAPPPAGQAVKFCIFCGRAMNPQARVCPNCNRPQW